MLWKSDLTSVASGATNGLTWPFRTWKPDLTSGASGADMGLTWPFGTWKSDLTSGASGADLGLIWALQGVESALNPLPELLAYDYSWPV